jgi:putative DNA primase/helicase
MNQEANPPQPGPTTKEFLDFIDKMKKRFPEKFLKATTFIEMKTIAADLLTNPTYYQEIFDIPVKIDTTFKNDDFLEGPMEKFLAKCELKVKNNKYNLSEFSFEHCIADALLGSIKYHPDSDRFFVWQKSQNKWYKDSRRGAIVAAMVSTLIHHNLFLKTNIMVAPNDKEDKPFAFNIRMSTQHGIEDCVRAIKKDVRFFVRLVDFDNQKYIVNFSNGRLNLKTFEFQDAGNHVDLVSKSTGYAYDQMATCLMWEKTLQEIYPDTQEIIPYIQELAGIALTGDIKEQALPFLSGEGANGKSLIQSAIMSIFGDYAGTLSSKALTTKRGDQTNDLAGLVGIRFVAVNEIEGKSELNIEIVKTLTSPGTFLKARFLYEEFNEFHNMAMFWWTANEAPEVPDSTISIWRRMKVIPHTQTFDAANTKTDRERLNKLIAFEREGILNWAVAGLKRYLQRGYLVDPACVKDAIEEYKTSQNPLQYFAEDCLVGDEGAKSATTFLYNEYCSYENLSNRKPLPINLFSHHLKSMEIHNLEDQLIKAKQYRSNHERGFLNIRCLSTKERDKRIQAKSNGEKS